MDTHTLTPAERFSAPISLTAAPKKHAIYAWRSDTLFEDNGTLFRGIRYSTSADPIPGWVAIGPVGCLFEEGTVFPAGPPVGKAPPLLMQTRPLVQFARRVSQGVAYTVELAPAPRGTSEYTAWIERRRIRFNDNGTVLGDALPPTNSDPVQLTRPLYSAEVRGSDGLPLGQAITTDLATWESIVDELPTPFALENTVVDDVTPLAQIAPIFDVEIDVVAGNIVPTVLTGIPGEYMGDLEIPPGTGSLIRFRRQVTGAFSLDDIVVKDSTGAVAAGFDAIVNTDATVLISNTAGPGLYDYSVFVTLQATGLSIHLDPKIRNRSTTGG